MASLAHHTPRRRSPLPQKDALKRPVKARPANHHHRKVAVMDSSIISISLDLLRVTSPLQDKSITTATVDSKREAFPFVLQPPAYCGRHHGAPINDEHDSDPRPIRLKPRFTKTNELFRGSNHPEHTPYSPQHGYIISSALVASDELMFPGLSDENDTVKNTKISLRPRPSGMRHFGQASLIISPTSAIGIGSTNIHNRDEPSLITPPSTPTRSQLGLHMPMSPPACLRKEPNFDNEDSLDDLQKLLLPHLK